MSRDRLRRLFHPFEAGVLPMPGTSSRALFLGAEAGEPPPGFQAVLAAVQRFRPLFLELMRAGVAVTPEAEGDGFDLALVLAGRHRGANERMVAEAIRRCRPGATVVVAGAKDEGIASLRRTVQGIVPVHGHLAKHHGIAFWLRVPDSATAYAAALQAVRTDRPIAGRYLGGPGMFSGAEVDEGSRCLVDALPARLDGAVADFCAGWGFIAAEAAERCTGIDRLDLYEADFAALVAARLNLAAISQPPTVQFYWHDLVSEPVERRYDTILMNPPFHAGSRAEPSLGQAIIAAAARALRPGGRLLMVANRHLPYEATLAQHFSRCTEQAGNARFKVMSAVR